MITKEEIIRQLDKFSKAKGKIVTVHTSLKAVGDIDGGGETLLSALIEYFTSDGGLLCIPTHTWLTNILDLRKSETCIGVLPCLAAAHPDAIRTLNPTHSMAVFGDEKKAREFAKCEEYVDSPVNPKGCYGKLYDEDGYVLLIGVGQESNTYLHCVEEMLNTFRRLTTEKIDKTIIHKDGRIEKRHLYYFDINLPNVSRYFTKFEAPFRYFGGIEDGKIGNAPVQLCNARIMKEAMERIYTNSKGNDILTNYDPVDEALYK